MFSPLFFSTLVVMAPVEMLSLDRIAPQDPPRKLFTSGTLRSSLLVVSVALKGGVRCSLLERLILSRWFADRGEAFPG
jgi:hypothetical protein